MWCLALPLFQVLFILLVWQGIWLGVSGIWDVERSMLLKEEYSNSSSKSNSELIIELVR